MNNPTSLTREQNLHTWSHIISECQEAKASGVKVIDWLKSHNISKDTYYYWYAEVRKEFLPEQASIVPVPSKLINGDMVSSNPTPVTCSPQNTTSTCIRLIINDVSIEVSHLSDTDTLVNVIKAVRYA